MQQRRLVRRRRMDHVNGQASDEKKDDACG
jgi:hypothetical protein